MAQQLVRQQQLFHVPAESVENRWINAARQGDLATLRELLPKMKNIDENVHTISALAAAAQGNHFECVEFLIDNGAAVDRRTQQGRSPLLYAAESGHFELMNYLVERGATHFTYTDQQQESYFVSYVIRQSITRRDVSRAIKNDALTALVLEYLSLGGLKVRPIERLSAHVLPNTHRKRPMRMPKPAPVVAPTPAAAPAHADAAVAASPVLDTAAAAAAASPAEVEASPEAAVDGADDEPRPPSPTPQEQGDAEEQGLRQQELEEAVAAGK